MGSSDQEMLEDRERVQGQIERLRWVIALRWVAFVGVAVADFLTQIAGYTGSSSLVPWIVAPLALSYNLGFFLWLRRIERAAQAGQWPLARIERSLRRQLYLQALCDIVVLNLLVYTNGGVEYPLFYVPLLALMLTGLLLPRSGVFLQANLGAALFALLALADYYGWIPHFYFLALPYQHDLYRDPRAVMGTVLSLAGVLNVAAFLISSVGQRLSRAESRARHLLGQLRRQVREASGQLATATTGLRDGAEEVSQVAGQIATTVQQIAQGAGQQAGQLERLSRSLEHLTEAGRRMAEGTQETHQASAETVSTADRGRQAAQEATARMVEITRVFAQAGEALDTLARHSEEIAEIASAIDRFAERTDLLALNAGIEAARAGEHGRGFAVVAGEVKKLAASSSASAEQVAEMVAHIQAEIAEVVSAVQAGMERVQRGQEAIATLQEVLDGMAKVIARTDELAGTMEHLSRQQMEAHQEIIRAAGEIASTAEQAAAGAEETAAAVEQQVSSFADFSRATQDLVALAAQLDGAVAGLSAQGEAPAVPAVAEAPAQPRPGGQP